MEDYLVDVPVKINIWIRPECQRRQFEVIKQARPSILFIQSDGGRNEIEWEAINANRSLVENGIDWKCQVYKIYQDHNNGLYSMAQITSEVIWSKVDRCIFFEDDQIPSVSYFRFCAELLEKYRDDQRIECICAMNHLGVCENVSSDYFFSRQGAIWGIATWRDRIQTRDKTFSYGKDPYVLSLLKQRTKHNKIAWDKLNGYAYNTFHAGHTPGGEFWIEFNMYAQNRVQIIPKYNMMKNIGFTANAAHSQPLSEMPKGIQRVFDMKTYEISFPLKHPLYVIPDIDYEKKRNRIMGYNYPAIKLYRGIENALISLKNGKLLSFISGRKARKRNMYDQIEK